MPGQSTIDSSSRPWWRPARFFQGLAQPWRPVGMYYTFGSYVPIYDLDPIAPGPGPYPYPVLLQLGARRLSHRAVDGFPCTDRRFMHGQRMSGDRFSAASAMND